MPAATPPICDFGWKAAPFNLRATDGRRYDLDAVRGEAGTVIAFICNHCPFVIATIDRFVEDARALQAHGVSVAAICSNDAVAYPADGFDKMAEFAAAHRFPFPYLHDADQSVARAYGAVCTPDWFGFNAQDGLQYRGRLDEGRLEPPPQDAVRELFEAMRTVAETGAGPRDQTASIGCSIKWKAA
ncbi:MAG: thioredoxin family protein [Alphaproteobacteria bacterium]|nr:thioredoxin family protein [Alphaproteobacteria bacterium]